MSKSKYKRKLTAILSADAVGYSRLMGDNEESTIHTLNNYRDLMTSLIADYNGSVVDAVGDNLLAEFTSVVDAVQCAVAIQIKLKKQNDKLDVSRHMLFRIGINIGDVVQEKDRIYGDGVNIAARIESLTEPGGVCISRGAYDHIKKKLGFGYEYIGEHTVKNISDPVRVYKVLMDPKDAGKRIKEGSVPPAKKSKLKKWLKVTAFIILTLFVVLAGVYWKYFYLPAPADIDLDRKTEFNLSKGPSIAVLPLKNITGDPDQNYFSDGLTDNIITGISANPRLFVIAQHSIFSYKNQRVSFQQVAEDLGIKYVLTGSVQKSNARVRINVKLVDINTGRSLWTKRYDRELIQLFEIQDEITIEIMRILEVELVEGEQAHFRLKGSRNLEAFMGFLRALSYWRSHNIKDNLKARRAVEAVIKLDSKYSEAFVLLSMTYLFDIWYRTGNPIISFAQASNYIKRALSIDDKNSDAYITLSHLSMLRRQHDNAIAAAKKAVLLNPNGADAYIQLAYAIYQAGKPIEAIEISRTAFLLNPLPPSQYYHVMGHFYMAVKRYEEAEEAYKKAVQLESNNIFANIGLATVYSLIGRTKEAQIWAENVRRLDPDFSVDDFYEVSPNKNRSLIKRYADALRRVGL